MSNETARERIWGAVSKLISLYEVGAMPSDEGPDAEEVSDAAMSEYNAWVWEQVGGMDINPSDRAIVDKVLIGLIGPRPQRDSDER